MNRKAFAVLLVALLLVGGAIVSASNAINTAITITTLLFEERSSLIPRPGTSGGEGGSIH